MILLEAIKSGKPFKRKSWATYVVYNPNCGSLQHYRTDGGIGISVDPKGLDLVMDDYELKAEECKHEPEVYRNTWNDTGPRYIHDADNLKCKHCGTKIKAEKWVEA